MVDKTMGNNYESSLDAQAGAASISDYTQNEAKRKTGELLAALSLERGLLQVKCIRTGSQPRMFWYDSPAALLRDLGQLKALNRQGFSIYFGVATYSDRKGTKDLAAWLFTVHADLDGKDYDDDWHTGKVIARGLLEALPATLQPSALVDTGHGFHAYWVLSQPLEANAATISQVEAVNAGLVEYLGCDPAAKDASRVLRLPGFQNVKEPNDPLPVTLEYCNDRRFGLDAFDMICAPPKVVMPPAARNGTDPRPGDAYNERGDWAELLTRHGWTEVGRRGETSYLCRPGKKDGVSARLNRGGDGLLRVFSSNAMPLEARSYSLFGAYGALDHNGDYTAAAVALAALGYGAPVTRPAPKTGVVIDAETGEALDLLGGANDEVNARLTHAMHGETFMHTESLGWLSYDGQQWATDGSDAAVDRAIVATLEARIGAAFATGKAEAHEKLIKFCAPNAQRIKGAKYNLSSLARGSMVEFDPSPDDLNTPSGVLNLRTGLVTPHSSSQRFMHVTAAEYDPTADQSAWRNYLADAFNNDSEILNWLQMAGGYTITGHTSEEVVFYLYGKKRAGKGLFTETLGAALGPQLSAELDFSTFTRDRTGDMQNFDLAPLTATRFVAASESQAYERLHEAMVKRITGGNRIYCALKFKNLFNYRPQFKIWLSSNHPINADPDDDAVWSRIRLIEFPNSYLGREDKTLKEALRQPEAMRGVLAWLVEGAKKWYLLGPSGLPELQRFIIAKDEQRSEIDTVQQWIDECCEVGSSYRTTSAALYSSYRDWASRNGVQIKAQIGLSRVLGVKGYTAKNLDNLRGFVGIRVASK